MSQPRFKNPVLQRIFEAESAIGNGVAWEGKDAAGRDVVYLGWTFHDAYAHTLELGDVKLTYVWNGRDRQGAIDEYATRDEALCARSISEASRFEPDYRNMAWEAGRAGRVIANPPFDLPPERIDRDHPRLRSRALETVVAYGMRSMRLAATALLAAAIIWLLIGAHQRLTQGILGREGFKPLGATASDSGKLLVIPLLLFIGALRELSRWCPPANLASAIIQSLCLPTAVALTFLAAGEFWVIPWGTDAETVFRGFWKPIPTVRRGTALLLAIACTSLGFDLLRNRLLPVWGLLALSASAACTYFMTPASWMVGVAWLLLAYALTRLPQRLRSETSAF